LVNDRTPALASTSHSDFLSDLVSTYFRKSKHRGKRKVVAAIEQLIGRRRWNVKTTHGFRIAVDINDMVQSYIMETGSWDSNVAAVLEQRWAKNDVFMDIGANIGLFSLLALHQGLKHVVAFEPLPSLADLLVANANSNRFSAQRLTVVREALGSTTGSANYLPGPLDNSGQGRIDLSSPADFHVPVQMTTLDTYLAANPSHVPNIMKVDVEGLELDVFQGASKLFKTKPPRTILFEADADERLEILDRRIVELLQNVGYKITPVDPMLLDTKANYLAQLC
jgi:FkbM family methyltransferase